MRIAVLVYGRLHNCAKHYDNILQSIGKHNTIDFFLSSDNSSKSLLNDFIRLYKPILYDNSPIYYNSDELNKYPDINPATHIDNMCRHFINKNRVGVLLKEYIDKENIQYDCVFSLRVDCLFEDTFVFDNLEENTIYIPAGYDYLNNAINDQIAYGKVDVMKKYNSINFIDLLDKKLSIVHPETLNAANIYFNNLLIERVTIRYRIDKSE